MVFTDWLFELTTAGRKLKGGTTAGLPSGPHLRYAYKMCAADPGLNLFARCPACQQSWLQLADSWGPGMTCPACGLPVPPGAVLGRFQLVREISSGGLGSVHEAIDSNSGRPVAIKTLKPGILSDAAAVSRFAHEAQIAASLSHPNIAEVYEFGHANGIYFLAMELLDHGSLAARIQSGRLPERDVLRVGLDVARGLQAASAKGLLHRDIKPGNIVFDPHGRAKLVDFGLAMPVEELRRGEGGAWGSPYYVPPERLDGTQEDFRSDIYSLGASLFHAAAGRPPFKATSASVAAWKHLKAQRVSVKAFAPHLSEETCSVINRCIERRPQDRYDNYFALIEALESALKHAMQSPETAAAPVGQVIGPGPQSDWGLRWITVGAVLVLVITGGIFYAVSHRGRNILEESGTEGAAVSHAKEDVSLRSVEEAPASSAVKFSEAEGYSAGDVDGHPDWQTDKRPTWQVAANTGSIHNSADLTTECHAFYRKPALLPPQNTLQGRVRFSFGGLGAQPSDQPWRIILSIKITDRQRGGNRGFEINWVKMGARPDVYESHIKVMNEAAETGQMQMLGTVAIPNADVGDDTPAPGDPSDTIELAYSITKGHNENCWSMELKFTNITKEKDIATFEKRDIATTANFFESAKFYGYLGGNGWGQSLDVFEWSFAGTDTGPFTKSADVDFSQAQGYAPGKLGLHPAWEVQGAPAWEIPDGGGSVRYVHPGATASAAIYQPMAAARSGDVIRGSVTFSFDGVGKTVSPNYRDLLKLCVCSRPEKPGSGVEMVFHRSKDSDESYTWHIRTTTDVSGTGELGSIGGMNISSADAGDGLDAAGDPSDLLRLDYELKKGPSDAFWTFSGKMSNATTGKELASAKNDAFPTTPAFYVSPGYFCSLRGTGNTSRLEIKSFRFWCESSANR